MHQRRDSTRNLLPAHVAMVQALLLQRWWTLRDLAAETNGSLSTAKWAVHVIGRYRYVFMRRQSKSSRSLREYRIFHEAVQVRKA